MPIFNIQDARVTSFETHTEGCEYLKNRAFGSLKNIRSARQQMKLRSDRKSARTAENCHMILMARVVKINRFSDREKIRGNF